MSVSTYLFHRNFELMQERFSLRKEKSTKVSKMSTINGKKKEKFKIFLKNLWGGGFGRSTSFAEPKPNRILRPKQRKSFVRSLVLERAKRAQVLKGIVSISSSSTVKVIVNLIEED